MANASETQERARARAPGFGRLVRWLVRTVGGRSFDIHGAEIAPNGVRGWFAEQVEIECRARSGFHLLPIGLIVGVALVYGAGWSPSFWVLLTAAMAALALVARFCVRPQERALGTFVAMVLCGATLAQWEIDRTATTVFSGEATVRITGTVLSREQTASGRFRYVISIEKTERPVLSRPPERARIVVSSRHEPLRIGDIYAGLVRLSPPSGPAYPGAYDFAFMPFFEGLGAYGYSLGAPDPVATTVERDFHPLVALQRWLATVRLSMTTAIREAIGGTEGAIAAALITGEQAGIPEDAKQSLRVTGLAHVLSISGLHMAIVAGFAMFAVRSGLSLIPALALRWPTKKFAAAIALLVSTFYLSISGAEVAPQRSYIMLAIMLTAVLLDRPALTLRNVAIAAVVVIVLAPHSVMSASFQMSFAATIALVGGYQFLTRNSFSKDRREPRGWLAGAALAIGAAAATSIIAGSATGPYAAYHFHRFALFGFVANVLTMPLFSFWIMPLALVGSLLIPFGLETLVLQAMGQGIAAVLWVADLVARHVPDQPIGRTTSTGLVLMTAAILTATCLQSRFRLSAIPLLVCGLLAARNDAPLPSLLIFEDGREVATLDEERHIAYRRERPSNFIADQWERAFAAGPEDALAAAQKRATITANCSEDLCLFVTPDGLRVAWTDDYEKTGAACDNADVAIVARAIRLDRCRSGAELVTLRTLRRTGSLAIRRDPRTGRPQVATAIPAEPEKWNRHRLAPWPEYWRKPVEEDPTVEDESLQPSDEAAPREPEISEPPAGEIAPDESGASEAVTNEMVRDEPSPERPNANKSELGAPKVSVVVDAPPAGAQ